MKKIFTIRSRRLVVQSLPGKQRATLRPAWSAGLLWNSHAMWVGAHYGQYPKRLCINLLPGFTIWVRGIGGLEP